MGELKAEMAALTTIEDAMQSEKNRIRAKIRTLHATCTALQTSFAASSTIAAAATGLSFLTFGSTLGIAGPSATVAAALCSTLEACRAQIGKLEDEWGNEAELQRIGRKLLSMKAEYEKLTAEAAT